MFLFLSFSSLLLGYAAIWLKKNPWIWGTCSLLSLTLVLIDHEIQPEAFLPLATIVIIIFSLRSPIQGLARFLLVSLAFLLSGAVFFALLPGFPACLKIGKIEANYGKTLVALFLLGWLIPTLKNKSDWMKALKSGLPLAILGAGFLTTLALYLSTTSYEFSISLSLLKASFLYLVFVIIPEEVLLRGFLQKELIQFLGKDFKARVCSVFISSSVFCLFHLNWMNHIPLLLALFASGLIYGMIYEITDHIESAIFCRFLTNTLYMTFLGNLSYFF